MNILISSGSYIFSDYLPGGEYQIAHAIVSRLARRGHRLYVLAPLKRLRQEIPNVTVCEIEGYNFVESDSYWHYHWRWWTFSAIAYWKARRLCKLRQIDIIHHIRPSFPVKFSLCWALSTPFVIGPLDLPWRASGRGDAVRWQRHGFVDPLLDRVLDRLNMTLGRYLWRKTLERAFAVPISVQGAQDMLPLQHQDAALIPLGVDTDRFCPPREVQKSEILFAGMLERRKGLDYLLRALPAVLKRIPGAHLTVVGGGRSDAEFRRLAEEMGVSKHVTFEGAIPFDRVATYYQRCEVFCLPSLGEPFGISLLQAMSCGKPVVSTRAGGVPDFVEDGRSGILVPPADAEQLADALQRLLGDAELCRRIGTYNRQICLERFSWDAVADRLEEVYRSAAGLH